MSSPAFDAWITALERRHLADLTFPEVSRSLRALSSTYVERRTKLREGAALSGTGKRAAFALFYGPLHYLILNHIVTSLGSATSSGATENGITSVRTLVDLGCGTGAAGAGWAGACERAPSILGVDRHRWALDEASRTFRELGLSGRARAGDIATVDLPKGRAAFLAAFALNELPEEGREALVARLLERAQGGDRVLIVEPLAGFVAPWWRKTAAVVESAGGQADEWRWQADLPAIVAKLDKAAGLHHRELTARSLFL